MKSDRRNHVTRRGVRSMKKSLVAGLLLSASCAGGDGNEAQPVQVAASSPVVAQLEQKLAGQDGDAVVAMPGTILNTYSTLGMPAVKGDKSLTVTNAADLKDARTGAALKKGDLLMLYQAQGATIDTTNDRCV